MEPLTTWTCDTCGDTIENVEDGYVVWRRMEDEKFGDFRIIHQARCDPGAERGFNLSLQLEMFLGEDGLAGCSRG